MMLGATIELQILSLIWQEKVPIWVFIAAMIVPVIFIFRDYYLYVLRDDFRLCFTNNSINYMLDGKLKRKIDIEEIPNYLLKPFF